LKRANESEEEEGEYLYVHDTSQGDEAGKAIAIKSNNI